MKGRACFCLAMVLAVCFAASVAHATLQDDVDQAVSIIERFEAAARRAEATRRFGEILSAILIRP